MTGFDEFSDGIKNVAKEAKEKAKEVGAAAVLHANVKAEELKIQEQYYKLGKKYYSLYKESPDLDLVDFVDAINTCNDKIEEYKKELKAEKNKEYHTVG